MYQENVSFEGQILTPSKRKKIKQPQQQKTTKNPKKQKKTKQNYQCPILPKRQLTTSKTERDVSLPFPKQGTATLPCPCAKSAKAEGVKDSCQALPKPSPS